MHAEVVPTGRLKLPGLLLVPTGPEEVEIHEEIQGYQHLGWSAVLTPKGMQAVKALLGEGHEEAHGWGGVRPTVQGPAAPVLSRFGPSRQKPWGDRTAPYALDYEQWCLLRGYR